MQYRVLVLSAGNERGGAASHIRVLARAVQDSGQHGQFVFGFVGHGPVINEVAQCRVHTVQFPVHCLRAVKQLRAALREFGRNVLLHSHGPRLNVIACAASVGRSHGWVSTVHSNIYSDFLCSRWKTMWFPRVHKTCLARAHGWFIVNPDFTDFLPAERAFYVPNGIDIAPLPQPRAYYRQRLRQQLGLSSDANVLGIAARLDPVKDIATIIRALAQMSHTAHLVIAGDGPERSFLAALSRQLQVAHRVHFLGFVDDVRSVYAGLDVHVLASLSEGTPFSLLEAGWFRIPNVGTEIPGITRLLSDGETGLLFPVRDAGALARTLDRLFGDPGLGARLADHFARRVMPQFTPERMLRAYIEGYERIMEGIGRGRALHESFGDRG